MINMNETLNFSAQSRDSDGNILIDMNASFTNGTALYISKNIPNVDLYISNKEIADTDFEQFEEKVLSKIRWCVQHIRESIK